MKRFLLLSGILVFMTSCSTLALRDEEYLVFKGQTLGKIEWVDKTCFISKEKFGAHPAFWGYKHKGYWFIINERSHINGLSLILTIGHPVDAPDCFKNLADRYN